MSLSAVLQEVYHAGRVKILKESILAELLSHYLVQDNLLVDWLMLVNKIEVILDLSGRQSTVNVLDIVADA